MNSNKTFEDNYEYNIKKVLEIINEYYDEKENDEDIEINIEGKN